MSIDLDKLEDGIKSANDLGMLPSFLMVKESSAIWRGARALGMGMLTPLMNTGRYAANFIMRPAGNALKNYGNTFSKGGAPQKFWNGAGNKLEQWGSKVDRGYAKMDNVYDTWRAGLGGWGRFGATTGRYGIPIGAYTAVEGWAPEDSWMRPAMDTIGYGNAATGIVKGIDFGVKKVHNVLTGAAREGAEATVAHSQAQLANLPWQHRLALLATPQDFARFYGQTANDQIKHMFEGGDIMEEWKKQQAKLPALPTSPTTPMATSAPASPQVRIPTPTPASNFTIRSGNPNKQPDFTNY